VWGWPAVVNFFLGGMAASYYLLKVIDGILLGGVNGVAQPAAFKVLAPALVSLGFLSLTVEAAKPSRGFQLILNLRNSWISREVLAGAVFAVTAALDYFLIQPMLLITAVSAAAGLLISQGFIVYSARAIPTWNRPLMPLLIITSGITTGSGLILLMTLSSDHLPGLSTLWMGLIAITLDVTVWFFYVYSSHDVAFRKETERLRSPFFLFHTIVFGRLVPFLVLFLCLKSSGTASGHLFLHFLPALAGLAMIAGGASQKIGILLHTGYSRSIVFNGQNKGSLAKRTALMR
jgi:DMSO reductase anchor subunit